MYGIGPEDIQHARNVLQAFEQAGVYTLLSSQALDFTYSKSGQAVELSNRGIPQLPTLTVSSKLPMKEALLEQIDCFPWLCPEDKTKILVVVKGIYGGYMGNKVYLMEAQELRRLLAAEDKPDVLLQALNPYRIDKNAKGESFRVIVVGGEAVAACQFVNKSGFRSNVEKRTTKAIPLTSDFGRKLKR
jgi:glutathione synthase/RimK-type ligase-like ATP-grasp enzyme